MPITCCVKKAFHKSLQLFLVPWLDEAWEFSHAGEWQKIFWSNIQIPSELIAQFSKGVKIDNY